ncbi:hypothetical protein [Lysobacter sp. HA18]
MVRRICLALGLAAFSFASSAKQAPPPMPVADSLPVEVVLHQKELDVVVPDTAAAVGAQFGLIGALIGAGIQNAEAKKAEEQVVPLRDLLLDYHFAPRVESVVRERLASPGLTPHPTISVMPTVWDAVDASQDKSTMPPSALVLSPRYSVDNTFKQMSVTLNAQLVDRTVKSNGKVKTSTRFNRTYAFRFPLTPGADGTSDRDRWVHLGSAQLAAMLDMGVDQVVDMLVQDFSAEGRAQWDQKPARQSTIVHGVGFDGLPVRKSDDYVWVRQGRGAMQSIQGFRPVSEELRLAVAAPAADANTATVAPAAAEVPVAVPAASAAPAAPVDAAPASSGAH